ncbi:MAG: sigma-70 family RNA polymerase sigma factor, partial [Clostridia bacterium]|nr:sigma-70 family RNA polymerase sigma factor [Clostridia bacterium]
NTVLLAGVYRMTKDVRRLIEELRHGDREVFNSIYEEYSPLIRSLVAKYCGGTDSSLDEDMTQEALIALYNSAMSYDLEQSEVSFGLYAKICISNRIISAMRKRTSSIESDEDISDYLGDADSDPSKQLDDRESARLLAEKMLSQLSSYERRVFRLYVQGVRAADIAELLGKTPKSVDNALSRIKNKIRKVL